jgi:hypothetical protein
VNLRSIITHFAVEKSLPSITDLLWETAVGQRIWPPFLIERNNGSPGLMPETRIQRSTAATRPGLFSRGTSTVAGSVRALERSSKSRPPRL